MQRPSSSAMGQDGARVPHGTSRAPAMTHTTCIKITLFHYTSNSTPFCCKFFASRRLCASLSPAHKACVHSYGDWGWPSRKGCLPAAPPDVPICQHSAQADNFRFGLNGCFFRGNIRHYFPPLAIELRMATEDCSDSKSM